MHLHTGRVCVPGTTGNTLRLCMPSPEFEIVPECCRTVQVRTVQYCNTRFDHLLYLVRGTSVPVPPSTIVLSEHTTRT